jgi:hypothetical protein
LLTAIGLSTTSEVAIISSLENPTSVAILTRDAVEKDSGVDVT